MTWERWRVGRCSDSFGEARLGRDLEVIIVKQRGRQLQAMEAVENWGHVWIVRIAVKVLILENDTYLSILTFSKIVCISVYFLSNTKVGY